MGVGTTESTLRAYVSSPPPCSLPRRSAHERVPQGEKKERPHHVARTLRERVIRSCGRNHSHPAVLLVDEVLDLLGAQQLAQLLDPRVVGHLRAAHQTVGVRAVVRALQHERVGQPGLDRSEEHTSELQSRENLVCRLLLDKKKNEK